MKICRKRETVIGWRKLKIMGVGGWRQRKGRQTERGDKVHRKN